jgi:uncharacterized protein YjbI with pentapeptide repeats
VANPEHVEILKKGVAEWNAWCGAEPKRKKFADLSEADLSEADLCGADLSFANLKSADLRYAQLRGANLDGANLTGTRLNGANLRDSLLRGARSGSPKPDNADLSGADLFNADLSGAFLSGANFSGSDLNGANLDQTQLRGADLTDAKLEYAEIRAANLIGVCLNRANLRNTQLLGARLHGADMRNAALFETIFVNVDLTRVIGLETCNHGGPSIIDHRTLQKSGPLPLAFLRGVGLPDNLIEYLPSLFNQAIQHYSCFISYSTKDDEFAKRLHADLQNNGVRCWFAPHDLRIGAKTWDAIDEAIKLRDRVLLVLSKSAIDSDWVEDEVQKAFAEERDRKQLVLFPIRIDDTVMETPEAWARKLRDQRNIGDFRSWKDHDAYKQSFERVLRDLTIKQ